MLSAALDAVGLDRAVIGLGDADLYRQLLAELGGARASRAIASWSCLAAHDLVGLEAEVAALGARCRRARDAAAPPEPARRPRGAGARLSELGGAAVERATRAALGDVPTLLRPAGSADRVSLDLGLLRDLGYYTGAILEVYDPALGHVLGGGGRYDELMGRFGRPLPAAGFALYLERVHIAQAEEERLTTAGAREEGS